MNLKNKVVFITGSSDGIGKETAIHFAKEGAKTVITYNSNKKGGEEVLEECKKFNDSILVHLNVTQDKEVGECIDKIISTFGQIDILVNNAGVVCRKNFKEQNKNEIDLQIDVNLKGLIKMTGAVLPHLEKQDGGFIINIASGAGKMGIIGLSVYCATKFGVRGFTQALAKELPKKIKIYSINPGKIATKVSNFDGTPPEKVAETIINAIKDEKIESGGDFDVFWKRG